MFGGAHLKRLAFAAAMSVSVFLTSYAQAQVSYIDILKSLTPGKKNIVTEIPDLASLQNAPNLNTARMILNNKLYSDQPQTESAANISSPQILDLAKKRTITFVVVPGVLGEFIDIRAFEEIFSRNSAYKNQWQQLADQKHAVDLRFNLQENAMTEEKLSDLINAASFDDSSGRPLFKIVILKTLLGSMESVGSNMYVAKTLNRRLQKYFDLTHDSNMVLLGYSRGTPLALEMITQAEKEHLSYLGSVRSVVSYAGVVMGSALADVTNDLNNENGQLKLAAQQLLGDLQVSTSVFDRAEKFAHNTQAIGTFVHKLAQNADFDPDAFLANARSGDFKTVAALIAKMGAEFGLKSILDFNGHVKRMQTFITEVLKAVNELTSASRIDWWKTHTLPKQIKYYSLAAAMVDPDKDGVENEIFHSGDGYSDSLDDQSLLGNKRTYERVTGVPMNDSQVAVYQSLFLPQMISNLNPQNSGLEFKQLGLLETHHWGVALEVVNKMRDGRLNPFPREKVLLALAAYLNQ